MSLAAKLLSASGGLDKLYVDDVFSTYLYTGNGSTQTINNGIDLAGKGGLIWTKARSETSIHFLINTVKTPLSFSSTDTTAAQGAVPSGLSFVSSGYSLPSNLHNASGVSYASWTFRKSPKFFDVVTYTGNGASSRAIAHLLGQEVGMVMTKATSTAGDWNTYHRSATGDLVLNTTDAQTGSKAVVNSATDTTFTVSGAANTNAVTYVAYLFAHDSSADGIVQCGSYVGNGSATGPVVTLGWEPQYLMVKNATGTNTTGWYIADSSRGLGTTLSNAEYLFAQNTNANKAYKILGVNSTGFSPNNATGRVNENSATYIYLAIRRPNKPPTSGTQVYNAIARTGTGAAATVTGVGFAPDLVISKSKNCNLASAGNATLVDRLRGASQLLQIANNYSERTDSSHISAFGMDGISVGGDSFYISINHTNENYINHFFKRAPGVFDVVCDSGTGAAHAIAHSLAVVPELMIRKKRSVEDNWVVYVGDATDYLILDNTAATADLDTMWNDTVPTASAFTVGTNDDVNQSAGTFVTYLFATKVGISKVGNYTGNGSSQTIPCGFTTGARFILIKRTDSAGDWYVWDTARGVVAGNDPHLSLNTTAAEVTTDDSIDPDTTGFIVNQLAATNINVTSASYIYLSFA